MLNGTANATETIHNINRLELSQQLLLQATHGHTDSLVKLVEDINEQKLETQLTSDTYKKSFLVRSI